MSFADRLKFIRRDSAFKTAVYFVVRGTASKYGSVDDLLWLAAYRHGFQTYRDGRRYVMGGAK